MPEVCRFYGIIIMMFYKDHTPPHFHAKYGNFTAYFDIKTGEIIDGEMPRRATRLIQDWSELNKEKLLLNWIESQKDNPQFIEIEPLI
jgi:hypothetical protein